jgi:O-antigen ligase
LAWFGWQLVAATNTVDASLTQVTLLHFAACVACFYLGLFALSQVDRMTPFWVAILAGFVWVLWIGFDQHFGGLEATQRWVYSQPNWREYPPDYLKRIASSRIFSTLVYPNALAGVILLFLPVLLTITFRMTQRSHRIVRGVAVGLLGYAGLACLYWSGSKAGWLIAMVLALTVVLRLRLRQTVKVIIVGGALVIGVTGFVIKFADYFQKGATSVSARLDYWRAALQIAKENPVLGTGPGTFSVPYRKIKAPESEMTRLVHNNYLEQASDSGVVGFLAYSWMILGSLVFLHCKYSTDHVRFAIWVGVFGWVLHGLVEFGLYIPALAWPAYMLFGWLWGTTAE